MNITLNINLPAALEAAGTLPAVALTPAPVLRGPTCEEAGCDEFIKSLEAERDELRAALGRAIDATREDAALINHIDKASECPEGDDLAEWIAAMAEGHRARFDILTLIADAIGFTVEDDNDTIDLDELLDKVRAVALEADQLREAVTEGKLREDRDHLLARVHQLEPELTDANKTISKLQALLDEARAAAGHNHDENVSVRQLREDLAELARTLNLRDVPMRDLPAAIASYMLGLIERAQLAEANVEKLNGLLGHELKGAIDDFEPRQVEVPLPDEMAQPQAHEKPADHSTLFQPGDPVTARQPGGQEEIGTVIRYDDRHGPTYWVSYRDGRSEGQFPIDAITRREADAPTEPELPAGVTRREYRAWLSLMQEASITENLEPQEFKRLRDAGLVDWATLKAKAAKIDEEAGQTASSTGLEIGEHAELETLNGKAVIFERIKPHIPLKSDRIVNDAERYVLKTPRDREIAQLALGVDGQWAAVVTHYPSPRFELLDDALLWVYARDKYTGGTSPADQNKKAKEATAPVPAERQPTGVTPEASAVAPDGKWANDLDPAKAERRPAPPGPTTPEARIDAAKAEMKAAVDVTLTTTDQNSPEWKAAEAKHAKAFAELQEAEEEKRKAAHPNPAAPAEVQAATKAIAEFEQLPAAHLEVGALVTIIRHTGEIATGTLAYTWEGTDKWEITLDAGGREVRPVNFIRGRAPEACPSCGGGPGLAYTCSCPPSDRDPSETAPEAEFAFGF